MCVPGAGVSEDFIKLLDISFLWLIHVHLSWISRLCAVGG